MSKDYSLYGAPSSSSATNRPKEFYCDTYDTIPYHSGINPKAPSLVRVKRPALVSDMPQLNFHQLGGAHSLASASTSLGFGLGLGRYGNEIPSPIDAEFQQIVLEMQQELAYVETLPNTENFRHSIRLLKERCSKLENTVDPDWVEVDINKPIRVTKRILIPNFRHQTINYVGRILGTKGITLQNICRKYKAHISVMGAGSTKDLAKEEELLKSGDPRYAHYRSPLHVRVDIIAAPHIAHTRLAGLLNLFNKLLMPVKEVVIEGINDAAALIKARPENGENEDILEQEIEHHITEEGYSRAFIAGIKRRGSETNGAIAVKSLRGARGSSQTSGGRGGRGGFVPRARIQNE